ncbi:MAG: heavy-metal-associated domain-containing protein, partial [Candidatus Marinimicrobia bacterium]|nr:heavy-metal-associated domain-containing protein [Candidatus Neomarinimicrobiota bacterium]
MKVDSSKSSRCSYPLTETNNTLRGKPMLKSPKIYVPISLLFVATLAVVWIFYPSGTNLANAALAEYQIEKLTCGSCVGKIEKAFSSIDGFGPGEINL